jgi:hypothetical protein
MARNEFLTTRNQRRRQQQGKKIKFMKNEHIIFKGTITHMSKTRLVRSALALGIVALIMQVSVPRAQAFDLSSLNGNYADSYQALVPANARQVLPPITSYSSYYTVALWTFDGAGGFTGRLVLNFGGGAIANTDFLQNITGIYTVDANGTGTMNWMVGNDPARRHFAIGAGGNELKYISTGATNGVQSLGTMVKQ